MKVSKVVLFMLVLSLAIWATAQSQPTPQGTPGTLDKNSSTPAVEKSPGTSPASAAPGSAGEDQSNPGDPLLDVPPLPKGKVSLIGGKVTKVDQVRNRLAVEPFGGGDTIKMIFDERTHIFRDGTETTQMAIHKGDRVYVDTMLDGVRVFARNIRVQSEVGPADASGQIEAFNSNNGILTLRDQLSAEPVSFRVDSSTQVKRDGQTGTMADVRNGSLVALKFAPGGRQRGVVKEISIIAVPGTSFTFAGRVTHLDLRLATVSVANQSDGKAYDLSFDASKIEGRDSLVVGSEVTIVATFTGFGYRAESVTLNPESASQP